VPLAVKSSPSVASASLSASARGDGWRRAGSGSIAARIADAHRSGMPGARSRGSIGGRDICRW
jgi:hypothetical protein